MSELNTATTNAINQINNKKEEVLQLITDNNLVTNDMFVGFQNDIQESMDETLGEYLSQVNAVRDDFQSTLDNLDWQKYKLTNDKGFAPFTNLNNDITTLHNLSPGFYYTVNTPGLPSGISTSGMTEVISRGERLNVLIKYTPYNSPRIVLKRFYESWSEWKEVTNNQTDTGWIPYTLINGAIENGAYALPEDNGFSCTYRTIESGGIKRKQIRFNVKNLTQNMNFAQLPAEFVEHTQVAPVRTPRNRYGAIVEIKADGKLFFTHYGDTWIDTDYIYGQYEWTE